MVKLTKDTILAEIYNAPEFAPAKDYLIGGGGDFFKGDHAMLTLAQLQQMQPAWDCEDIVYGLKRLRTLFERGEKVVYSVYSEEEIAQNPERMHVALLSLPAEHKATDLCAILLAGGAYGSVCTMVEALPVAAKLNELGVACFCLNYRTAKKETLTQGLFPKPLDDLAAAWRFIRARQDEFGINAENYIAGGFSAGGHTAAMWGTRHLGFRKYALPAPRRLLLAYPLISMDTLADSPVKDYMLTGMFGAERSRRDELAYEAHLHVDSEYPEVFLIQSVDDDTVPIANAERMRSALNAAGVHARVERIQSGGHGFGLGTATPGSGWPERALRAF